MEENLFVVLFQCKMSGKNKEHDQ